MTLRDIRQVAYCQVGGSRWPDEDDVEDIEEVEDDLDVLPGSDG